MMRCWWLCMIAFCLCACSTPTPTPPAPPAPPPPAAAAHLVIAVQGAVQVHRDTWANTDARTPALLGMALRHGDLIDPGTSGQVTIACADLTTLVMVSQIGDTACPEAPPVLTSNGSRLNPTRSAEGVQPILLSPRKTKLLTLRPTLRWLPVDGVTTYHVAVTQGGTPIWETDVPNQTSIIYPEDARALEPARTYLAVVTTDTRSSLDEGLALGFTLLDTTTASRVQADETRIRSLVPDDTATRLLLANLYAEYDLYAEAIEQLDGLPDELRSREPVIMSQIGAWSSEIGLNDLATDWYNQALARSEEIGDHEGQAQAHDALGRIYAVNSQHDQATSHFAAALALYETLGDSAMVARIRAERAQGNE